jgi:hypothetical protein
MVEKEGLTLGMVTWNLRGNMGHTTKEPIWENTGGHRPVHTRPEGAGGRQISADIDEIQEAEGRDTGGSKRQLKLTSRYMLRLEKTHPDAVDLQRSHAGDGGLSFYPIMMVCRELRI